MALQAELRGDEACRWYWMARGLASRSLGWLKKYEMRPAIFDRLTYCEKPVPVPDTHTSLARVQAVDLIHMPRVCS
jgi:hypothetical protein